LGGSVTLDEKNGVVNVQSGVFSQTLKQNGMAAMTIGSVIFWADGSNPTDDSKVYAHELVHANVQSKMLGDNYLLATVVSYVIGAAVSLEAGHTSIDDMHDASPLEMHADIASRLPTKGPGIWREALNNVVDSMIRTFWSDRGTRIAVEFRRAAVTR
jgi:hypothetical protein